MASTGHSNPTTTGPSRADIDASDYMIYRILKARAEGIEQALREDPGASLSATDISVLKELGRVSAKYREQGEAAEAEKQPEAERDPRFAKLGYALVRGEVRECMGLVDQLREGKWIDHPRQDFPDLNGAVVLNVWGEAQECNHPGEAEEA